MKKILVFVLSLLLTFGIGTSIITTVALGEPEFDFENNLEEYLNEEGYLVGEAAKAFIETDMFEDTFYTPTDMKYTIADQHGNIIVETTLGKWNENRWDFVKDNEWLQEYLYDGKPLNEIKEIVEKQVEEYLKNKVTKEEVMDRLRRKGNIVE